VYAEITGNASGSTWSTDSTILSINNALGYGVSDETAYGDELITNVADREFTSDTGYWTLTESLIANNVCTVTNTSAKYFISRDGVVDIGNRYKALFEVKSLNLGSMLFSVGGGTSSEITANGAYSNTAYASSNDRIRAFATENSDLSIDNLSVKQALEQSVNIPISTTNPSLTVLSSQPTYLGQANYDLKLTKQNCVETTNTEYLQASENLIDGNKWAFEIDLAEVDTNNVNVLLGNDTDFSWLSWGNAGVFSVRVVSTIYNGTKSVVGLTDGNVLIVYNSTKITVYFNGTYFDEIARTDNLAFNRLLNYKNLTQVFKGKASHTKIWDLSAYTSGEIDALDFSTLAPTNYFALNEYDSDKTLPATKTFYDKMGTGVTLTLENGSDANIDKMEGLSQNLEDGFATTTAGGTTMFPRLDDETGYAGTTGLEAGFTAYKARTDQSEQNVLAEETAAFIAKDKSTKVCTSAGTTYVASTQAYGVWEFDVEKVDESAEVTIYISSDSYDILSANNYRLRFDALERISFAIMTNGVAVTLFRTSASYFDITDKYRVKVIRLIDGTFFVYIKYGEFGNDYVLVDTAGGLGSNPLVDNTHTSSAFLISELKTNAKFGNLTKNLIPVAITDFTDGTGTFEIAGEFFDKDGNAVDKPLSELVTNDYITKVTDENSSIIDLKIAK